VNSDPLSSDFAGSGATSRAEDARESLHHLLAASLVTLVLWFVPYVGLALYPVRLFVTYVHEIGHAVAALLTMNLPYSIEIFWDTSGVTMTSGMNLVIASAGYVGATIAGAALLLLAARRGTVRPALVVAGGALIVAAVWLGGNLLAWVAGLGIGAVLVALGLRASPRAARFALSFLAIQCMLDAFSDLKTLFWLSIGTEAQTDARNMSVATGGLVPAVVWTVLWAAIAVAVLAVAVRLYYRATVSRVAPS
jgi:peptidase M50B-like protein